MPMHLVLSAFTSRSDEVLSLQIGLCAEVYFVEEFIFVSAANRDLTIRNVLELLTRHW
jgi:hypothetical protein